MRFRSLLIIFLSFFISNIRGQENSYNKENVLRLIEQARNLKNEHQFENALKYSDSAIVLAKQSKRNDLIIQAVLAKSDLFNKFNYFKKALTLSQDALKISKRNNLDSITPHILFKLGDIYRHLGQKQKALDNLTQALVLFENDNNQKRVAKVYSLLGVLQAELGNFQKGQTYLQKSLKIHQLLGDQKMVQRNWMGIGYSYFREGKYRDAKKYFLKLLHHLPADNKQLENLLYLNLATIYQRLRKLDSAYFYQIKAIHLAKNNMDDHLLATLYYNASTVKYEQKQLDSTQYFAQKGLQKAKQIKYFDRVIDNLLILQQLDSLKGNTDKQVKKLHTIIQYKDSILSQERLSIAKKMEKKYAELKKDEIIALQHKNLDVAKEKNQFLKGIIFLSIVLGLILLMFAFTYRKLLYKNKILHQVEIKQMQEQLINKEKELMAIALQVEQKNLLIDKFYQKLKKTTHNEMNNKDEVNSILSDVKSSLNIQKDVDLFSAKFADLHHDFIGKLKREYPQLSIKEIKFLSFIKVGLSTKQIAGMQNITVAAVHKMRYRIKKKLLLNNNISLDEFVMNLR